MNKKYPHIKIETIDKNMPPIGQNVNVFLDGQNISHAVTGIEVSIMVNHLAAVTLHLYAHTEIDGLVLRGES